MAGIVSTVLGISAILDVVSKWKSGKKIGLDKINTPTNVLKEAGITEAEIKLFTSGGDMVKMLGNHIIEPTIIISKSMYARKDITSVIESTVDAYIAFYVAVFKVLVNVYKLEPSNALSLLANKGFDIEGIQKKVGVSDLEGMKSLPIDSEAIGDINRSNSRTVTDKANDYLAKTVVRNIDITVSGNSSVERVTVKKDSSGNPVYDDNGNEVAETSKNSNAYSLTIPLVIKANIHVVDIEDMVDSFKHRGHDAELKNRLIKWRVGAITTKQFWTASDLIEEYKKSTLNPDNFSSYINKKSIADLNILNIIQGRQRGLNKMVVSYIMSEKELASLSEVIGYDINNRAEKQKLMNAMLAFNVTTINTDREMVSVYISSISGFSVSPIKKLSKSAGKDTDGIELLATALMSNKSF